MKKSLMNKFTLKILSLLIAMLIWLLVVNVQDPITPEIFTDIPVTFVNESYIEKSGKLALMVEGKDTVNVRVRGENSIIRNMSKDNITAVADLTQIIDMTTQPIMVPVTVTCPGIKDKNVEVTPRNIPITIEERESIDCIISTELVGESKPDKNYEVGKTTAEPEKITITGPKSVVENIDNVTAKVNVDGMTESGERNAELVIYDKNHDELTDKQMASLKFDIPSTTVKVNVELWRMLQGVTIDALNSYVGEPLNGYQVGKITSTPEKINIIGSDEALAEVHGKWQQTDHSRIGGQRYYR